jgi:HAD superfamily hydrolase (TIGR01509 family)
MREAAIARDLPALVIFDCDGVLIDSEVIASRIFVECLGDAGISLTLDEAMRFGIGKSAVTLVAAVEQEFGRTLPAGFVENMRARTIDAFTHSLKPVDGIAALLAALSLPRCVASNSHIDRVRHALATTGLLAHLDPHIYTAAMVARGKPAPDLFLYAAAQHGVAPSQCLVVEDSLSGVAAAQAAEIPVVGFVGASHCRAGHAEAMMEAGCLQVFVRMDELGQFLDTRPERC